MSVALKSNDSIVGYITNVSNENKKTKFYVKFTMQCKNGQMVDGWVFGNASGILSTALGISLTDSFKNHSGLRLWGKLEDEKGMLVFKTQSWAKFQRVNPDFLFQGVLNNIASIQDALMSTEPSSIRAFIVDVRAGIDFFKNGTNHTNTFLLIGDPSGTTYLAVINLAANTVEMEKTYDISQVRRKMFNGVPILITTINTHITFSAASVIADISDVATTLSIDLCDKKRIISSIEEIGAITRSTGCSTCKGSLIDVAGAASLVYCSKCQRHSLKKNNNLNYSTSFIIKNGEEKIFLTAHGEILGRLFSLAGVSLTANDAETAVALLSSGDFCFEYSEFHKDLIAISKIQ